MSLLSNIQKKNTIPNSKGGRYYSTTYNSNLDFFAGISRFQDVDVVLKKFEDALAEDETLALANLLLLLDIRGGKGERRLFKTCYKYLCNFHKDLALKILPLIPKLGRWDYVLEGIATPINDETLKMVKRQFQQDLNSNRPSLLAKWLPSHRNHGKNNPLAKKIYSYLGLTEKEYRKELKELRSKLNIVEHNLTNQHYDIDFEKVPTKAMLKYRKAFERHCYNSYLNFLESVSTGDKKINTNGLYCYEIIQKIYNSHSNLDNEEILLLDNMWKNQKDFLKGNDSNVLVMADTSGSMTYPNNIPISNSVGLAVYIAERNHGFFQNYFITFSFEPKLQKVSGMDIVSKVENIQEIIANTDIDKAFKLVLESAKEENLSQEEMPSHIIIISDMEFDEGCYCTGNVPNNLIYDPVKGWKTTDGSKLLEEDDIFDYYGRIDDQTNVTNLEGWKKAFKEAGYELPKIIFWNVAVQTFGLPATSQEDDIAMVSGFSPYILENILNPEEINPELIMVETLQKYIDILEKQ